MKKYSIQHTNFLIKKSRKLKRKKKLPKGSNTKQYRAYQSLHRIYKEKFKYWDGQRRKFYLEFYKPVDYADYVNTVVVSKPIGTESDIDYLAEVGFKLINGAALVTNLDIRECARVWPSGVMAFCSFKHWTDLTAKEGTKAPRVSSTNSKKDDVSAYLDFCGFHNYVNRRKSDVEHEYSDNKVVKIQRESNANAFNERFDEIASLVKGHTDYDSDELESFKSNILSEILINVTEHGINYLDMGWYTLAQVHPTNGFISLNIADNGIGIANSLKTGPQKIKLTTDEDHKYILEAFKQNVSGAFSASIPKKMLLSKKFEKGQRRGSGLMYILGACAELGITFSLISSCGYVQYDSKGNCIAQKTYKGPIFAGTLYSLKIPLKRNQI